MFCGALTRGANGPFGFAGQQNRLRERLLCCDSNLTIGQGLLTKNGCLERFYLCFDQRYLAVNSVSPSCDKFSTALLFAARREGFDF